MKLKSLKLIKYNSLKKMKKSFTASFKPYSRFKFIKYIFKLHILSLLLSSITTSPPIASFLSIPTDLGQHAVRKYSLYEIFNRHNSIKCVFTGGD